MKDQRTKANELAETNERENQHSDIVDDGVGEDTRRMRSLTVQEIEQILRDEASKKPRS